MAEEIYSLSVKGQRAFANRDFRGVARDLKNMLPGQSCVLAKDFLREGKEHDEWLKKKRGIGLGIQEKLNGNGEDYKVGVGRSEDEGKVFHWNYLMVKRVR